MSDHLKGCARPLMAAAAALLWYGQSGLAGVGALQRDLAEAIEAHQGGELADDDAFGFSVAADGNTLAVGAINQDGDGVEDQGAVYVFVHQAGEWKLQAHLLAGGGSGGDNFGSAVALSGDTLAVGAFHKAGPSGFWQGAVYVFVRQGTVWMQRALLLIADAGAQDAFGSSVDLDGDTLVAGAWAYAGTIGSQAGAAYVFVREGERWTQQARLTRSGGAKPGDVFGHSVAVSGDLIAVGCSGYDGPAGNNQGTVQLFSRNGSLWQYQGQVGPRQAAAEDYFGRAVDLDGTTLLVGGYGRSASAGSQQGAAWVFEKSGDNWIEQARLMPSDPQAGDNFGWSVSTRNGRALIGAPQSNGPGAGKVYLFARASGKWPQMARLAPALPDAQQRFGFSVGLARSYGVGGAWYGAAGDGTRPGMGLGFELTAPADFNLDRRVDDVDLQLFLACSMEPATPYTLHALPPGCPQHADADTAIADLDGDGYINQQDFGLFQRCITGSLADADVDCAE